MLIFPFCGKHSSPVLAVAGTKCFYEVGWTVAVVKGGGGPEVGQCNSNLNHQ